MTNGDKLIEGVLELERLKREEKTEEELQAIADTYDWSVDLVAIKTLCDEYVKSHILTQQSHNSHIIK